MCSSTGTSPSLNERIYGGYSKAGNRSNGEFNGSMVLINIYKDRAELDPIVRNSHSRAYWNRTLNDLPFAGGYRESQFDHQAPLRTILRFRTSPMKSHGTLGD
jgi:hypothetical protein